FQAGDGIRDFHVTGVQTCALPISELAPEKSAQNTWLPDRNQDGSHDWRDLAVEKEEIVLLEDTTGDGRANTAKVVISDFNEEVRSEERRVGTSEARRRAAAGGLTR